MGSAAPTGMMIAVCPVANPMDLMMAPQALS
jgi:hypothetical protein